MLPKTLIDQLSEHSSCFVVFYFDSNGEPCFCQNTPETKDLMAMTHFVREYLDGQLFKIVPGENSEEDENSN